jgi:hypothetical protein
MPDRAPLGPEEVAQAAATVRRVLAAVADGTFTADAGMVARLEGAALALEVVAGSAGGRSDEPTEDGSCT